LPTPGPNLVADALAVPRCDGPASRGDARGPLAGRAATNAPSTWRRRNPERADVSVFINAAVPILGGRRISTFEDRLERYEFWTSLSELLAPPTSGLPSDFPCFSRFLQASRLRPIRIEDCVGWGGLETTADTLRLRPPARTGIPRA